jgi:uncharacterized protein YdbL (DUF1318 family)
MKKFWMIFIVMVASFGCARVRVEAPKDPIKLDISMRLDIYQHVAKDIDAIENIVSGNDQKPVKGKQGSMLSLFVEDAYAQESFSPEVEEAAYSRRDRKSALVTWEEKGVIGENKLGLVEVRDSGASDSSINSLINAENSDRMVIYKAIAAKNGTSVEEVQKIYAKKLQDGANSGTPIETLNESTGQYEWNVK